MNIMNITLLRNKPSIENSFPFLLRFNRKLLSVGVSKCSLVVLLLSGIYIQVYLYPDIK